MKKKILLIVMCSVLAVVGMSSLLACSNNKGEPYNLIIANNDSMAIGAVNSLDDMAKDIPIIGVDALETAAGMVDSGKMAATVKQQSDLMAQATVEIVSRLANGMNVAEAYADTRYSREDIYTDRDLDVGIDSLNYTAKESGVVRIPYLEYTKEGTTLPEIDASSMPSGAKVKAFFFENKNDYMISVKGFLQSTFSAIGYNMQDNDFIYADNDTAKQKQQLESAISGAGSNDIFIMNPVEPTDTTQFNDLVKNSGKNIKIVFINKQDTAGAYDYAANNTVYIGSDLDGGGIMQGQIVAELLKTGGRFAVQREDNSEVTVSAMLLMGERTHPDAIYRTITWIQSANKELEGTGIKIDFEAKLNGNPNIYNPSAGQEWTTEGAKTIVDSVKAGRGFKSPKDL